MAGSCGIYVLQPVYSSLADLKPTQHMYYLPPPVRADLSEFEPALKPDRDSKCAEAKAAKSEMDAVVCRQKTLLRQLENVRSQLKLLNVSNEEDTTPAKEESTFETKESGDWKIHEDASVDLIKIVPAVRIQSSVPDLVPEATAYWNSNASYRMELFERTKSTVTLNVVLHPMSNRSNWILAVLRILSRSRDVNVRCEVYGHSSLSDFMKEVQNHFQVLFDGAKNDSKNEIIINLIWKFDKQLPQLTVTELNHSPIFGERAVIQYLGVLIGLYPVSDHKDCTNLDYLIDRMLMQHKSPDALFEQAVSILSSRAFLVDEQKATLADCLLRCFCVSFCNYIRFPILLQWSNKLAF